MAYGIITGSALYNLPQLKLKEQLIQTHYGDTKVFLSTEVDPPLVFIPRHGVNHTIPPHKINYRANLMALKTLGVTKILAAYAVGSINPDIPPLSMVALNDFIDFTNGRISTFFDGEKEVVEHTEMSQPYDPILHQQILQTANSLNIQVREKGIYVCSNGPRLETPSEIRMFRLLGADVVGMTGVPEVVLAKELNIPFAAIAFSVNWAAGIEKTVRFLEEGLEDLTANLINLMLRTLYNFEE